MTRLEGEKGRPAGPPRLEPWRPGAAPGPSEAPGEPACEMCGSPVVAHHCKRICRRCGFMTGCSEGI